MAKRGRKPVPCPDVPKLRNLVETGELVMTISRAFVKSSARQVYRWCDENGLQRPRRVAGGPMLFEGLFVLAGRERRLSTLVGAGLLAPLAILCVVLH